MGREINEGLIRELERKIEGGTGDITQLKRTRNSLLNISMRVPPEILGQTFWWRVQQDLRQLRGLLKDTYNFLLVCHHWSEVASRTPELWSYWGDTLREWLQQSKRSGTAPVDLVLCGYYMVGSRAPFDEPLREALKARANRHAIRSIHLSHERQPLLTSVLSALTPDDGHTSIESISLRDVDASNFFTRCRFPKLWFLSLSTGDQFSAWGHLALHTAALTTLALTIGTADSCAPTTTQLLSILASNPRLQSLKLSGTMIPRDEDRSAIPVPLRHLKKLIIKGNFHPVFQLLQRLDYSKTMDHTTLNFTRCAVEDVLGILGPYVRHHIQRDGRFQDGLGILVDHPFHSVSILVSAIKSVEGLVQNVNFAKFTAVLRHSSSRRDMAQLCAKFVAQVPVEHVVNFGGDLSMDAVEEMVSMMPNIQRLHLTNARLYDGFLQPNSEGPLAQKKLLPSLRHLWLDNPVPDDKSWRSILPYLTHQTSNGQRISLIITGRREHICKDVVKEMEILVDNLILDLILDDECPFDLCIRSEEDDG